MNISATMNEITGTIKMLNIIEKKKIGEAWQKSLYKNNAIYNFIIGGRNGRKSTKIQEKILNDYFKRKELFILIRRKTDETITENWFTPYIHKQLFDNHKKIVTFKKSINKGERYTGYFLISDINGDNEQIIGKVLYLSMEQKYKSNEAGYFSNFKNVVFEEFIANEFSAYLPNEVQKLVNLISTVFRDRTARVYLIGNTLTGQESNPYFRYFELDDLNLTVNNYYLIANEFDIKISLYFVANVLPDSIPDYQKIKGNLVGTTGEWAEDRNYLKQDINKLKNVEIEKINLLLLYRGNYYYIYRIKEENFKREYVYITTQILNTSDINNLEEFKQTLPKQHRNYKNNLLHALYPEFFKYNAVSKQFDFIPKIKKEKIDMLNIDDLNIKKSQSQNDNIKLLEVLNQQLYNTQLFCDNKSLLFWLKTERKEYVKAVIL